MRISINPHRHATDDIHPVLCKCPRQFPRNLASIGTSCPRPDNCHTLSCFFWQPANIIQRIRCCRNPAELLRVPRIFHADKTDSFLLQFSPALLYIPLPPGLCNLSHILFIQNPDFFIRVSCNAYSSSAPIPSVIRPVSLCTVSPLFASQYAYILILPYLPRIYPRYSGNTQLLSDHRHGCFPPFVYRQLFVPPGGFYGRCAQ